MAIPTLVCATYLILGMVTTISLWVQVEPEIEMALDLEESEIGDEMRGPIRLMVTLLFMLFWPLVIYDLIGRK